MAEDRFASYDAAYVLGALSPRDRQEYEQHLRDCPECARAVRELAGMPGLLAKVPADLVPDAEPAPEGPPPALLAELLGRVRSERRRTRWTAVGASVVAVAACLALVLFLALRPPPAGEKPVSVPTATMSPVGSAPVWATIGLEDVAWGTKVNMRCSYDRSNKYGGAVYVLAVIAEEGDVERIGSWTVQPDEVAKVQAATSWSVDEIEAIEVRTSSGRPLLRMTP